MLDYFGVPIPYDEFMQECVDRSGEESFSIDGVQYIIIAVSRDSDSITGEFRWTIALDEDYEEHAVDGQWTPITGIFDDLSCLLDTPLFDGRSFKDLYDKAVYTS